MHKIWSLLLVVIVHSSNENTLIHIFLLNVAKFVVRKQIHMKSISDVLVQLRHVTTHHRSAELNQLLNTDTTFQRMTVLHHWVLYVFKVLLNSKGSATYNDTRFCVSHSVAPTPPQAMANPKNLQERLLLWIQSLLFDPAYYWYFSSLVVLGDAVLTLLIIRFVPCKFIRAFWPSPEFDVIC